ncbi:hypothetical protein [Acidithiobacillus sp.]|uniref:hypothetical protein n=1 Tax=Acidithiobacillus sp. TaxID=1872118 RepID=UPI0025BE3C56|nr:hypothetical protein [Acidithiobacillus sp.]
MTRMQRYLPGERPTAIAGLADLTLVLRWIYQQLDPNPLLLGFARRFTGYKRTNLLLTQPEDRLREWAKFIARDALPYVRASEPYDEPTDCPTAYVQVNNQENCHDLTPHCTR